MCGPTLPLGGANAGTATSTRTANAAPLPDTGTAPRHRHRGNTGTANADVRARRVQLGASSSVTGAPAAILARAFITWAVMPAPTTPVRLPPWA